MMGHVITYCMILNNMIIEDEYDAEACNSDYLFEDADTFAVDLVECTDLTDSCLFSNNLSTI
jgi:hypothetical protein